MKNKTEQKSERKDNIKNCRETCLVREKYENLTKSKKKKTIGRKMNENITLCYQHQWQVEQRLWIN